MSSQLAPLVWQALDENLVVRAEVASALGRPDDRAKALVDDDGARLAAAYDALRRQPAARRSFQRAFAARDRSIRERSVAHEALAKLFHHGTVELVISVNWDTQLERSYESLYRCRRTLADGLWKIHGDADQPDQDWILPGDAGHVPPELLAEIEALVRDRPRVLLIVGYSESDKRIVEALTRPLAARWVVCRVGPAVTGSLDLRGTAEQILPQLAKRLVPEAEMPGWQFVGQGKLRGLRRARSWACLSRWRTREPALPCPKWRRWSPGCGRGTRQGSSGRQAPASRWGPGRRSGNCRLSATRS